MSNLLIIDDDVASCRTLQLHFQSQEHVVNVAHSGEDGITAVQSSKPDLIILDIRMPGKDGLEVLQEFKQICPDTPVIMITAHHDMDSTITAMKEGADDYIHKPVDIHELDDAVTRIMVRQDSNSGGMPVIDADIKKSGANTMIGSSHPMRAVFKTIGLIAPKPVNVLLTGESGTGKELVARAIHEAGIQSSGPFVAVNCAALVETLLESELFGHEKGAFTGAVNRHIGKFSLANKGTIFLDEISDLSLTMQAKLLRVLQEKEYVPLGGNHVQISDARVIAATNADLMECVEKGSFREDLFYRLQVATIHLPPLRERKEDIFELTQVMLGRIRKDMHRRVKRVSLDVMDSFLSYDWPGNVRELEHTLMKAVATCTGDMITRENIPEGIYTTVNTGTIYKKPLTEMTLEETEMAHVAQVLKATGWHRGRSCEILGISRPRLRRMIKQYCLVPPAGMQNCSENTFDHDIEQAKKSSL